MTRRVLICDDDLHSVSPLAFKFEAAGYDVERTMDGGEAWEAIQRHVPDLLITDILMPELDGFALVERIRSHDESRELPVIVLTATALDDKTTKFADQMGIAHVVSKPYSPKEVLARAKQLLAGGVDVG